MLTVNPCRGYCRRTINVPPFAKSDNGRVCRRAEDITSAVKLASKRKSTRKHSCSSSRSNHRVLAGEAVEIATGALIPWTELILWLWLNTALRRAEPWFLSTGPVTTRGDISEKPVREVRKGERVLRAGPKARNQGNRGACVSIVRTRSEVSCP